MLHKKIFYFLKGKLRILKIRVKKEANSAEKGKIRKMGRGPLSFVK